MMWIWFSHFSKFLKDIIFKKKLNMFQDREEDVISQTIIGINMDPPQLYSVYLSWDDNWIFMEECPNCYAIIPSNRDLCHHCPDISKDLWKKDVVELNYILAQATIFRKVERISPSA
jgi:hypothetical protein